MPTLGEATPQIRRVAAFRAGLHLNRGGKPDEIAVQFECHGDNPMVAVGFALVDVPALIVALQKMVLSARALLGEPIAEASNSEAHDAHAGAQVAVLAQQLRAEAGYWDTFKRLLVEAGGRGTGQFEVQSMLAECDRHLAAIGTAAKAATISMLDLPEPPHTRPEMPGAMPSGTLH